MALSLLQSAALMQNMTLRNRIKVACMRFADYVLNEPPDTPARNARQRWATNAISSPDTVASQVQPSAVMDPNVQAAGEDVTDQDLQSAVEAAVQRML
jgi:hypothetical protein